jgi:hypothetical protein
MLKNSDIDHHDQIDLKDSSVNLLTSSKVFDFVFTETVCFPQMIENGL